MRRIAAIGLGLFLAVQAVAGQSSEVKAGEREEILEALDRYQEVATRCYFAGQEYDVDFIFDALLDTNKIFQAMTMAMNRLAAHINPRPVQIIGEGAEIDPKFTNCFPDASKARGGKSPVGGEQSANRPTIIIAVLATNIDNGPDIAGQTEIYSEVSDGWPAVMLDENGDWYDGRGFQDYITMVASAGPARLIRCLQNRQPSFEKVPSRFLVDSMIMHCKATKSYHAAALMLFGLGNFVGWGQFDETKKLAIEDAGYFALEFEVFRSLSELVGE